MARKPKTETMTVEEYRKSITPAKIKEFVEENRIQPHFMTEYIKVKTDYGYVHDLTVDLNYSQSVVSLIEVLQNLVDTRTTPDTRDSLYIEGNNDRDDLHDEHRIYYNGRESEDKFNNRVIELMVSNFLMKNRERLEFLRLKAIYDPN